MKKKIKIIIGILLMILTLCISTLLTYLIDNTLFSRYMASALIIFVNSIIAATYCNIGEWIDEHIK